MSVKFQKATEPMTETGTTILESSFGATVANDRRHTTYCRRELKSFSRSASIVKSHTVALDGL